MPIFRDSYQTTVGSVFVTKQIETAIKEAIIKDGLDTVNLGVRMDGDVTPVFITGSLNSESEIQLFTHPISIFNFQHKNFLVTDLRSFIRPQTPITDILNGIGIKNMTEYNFAKSRAILNLLWMNQKSSQIKNGLSFAGVVFARWISEILAKAFALDFKDQTTLAVISSFYYQSLFSEESVFDEQSKQKMAVHTIKATGAPADFVFQIFDKIKPIDGIEDFCTNVVDILENVRLKNFNLPLLLNLVKNSWYGTNAKDILPIALEHPPTWCAIVFAAVNERTYKNSAIARVAERFGKRGAADEFNQNYVDMMKSQSTVATEELVVTIRNFD